jgi:hypothetical protein
VLNHRELKRNAAGQHVDAVFVVKRDFLFNPRGGQAVDEARMIGDLRIIDDRGRDLEDISARASLETRRRRRLRWPTLRTSRQSAIKRSGRAGGAPQTTNSKKNLRGKSGDQRDSQNSTDACAAFATRRHARRILLR